MDIEARLALSYYSIIADINPKHHVYLVRDSRDGRIYVRKDLTVYKLSVYNQLMMHPVPGIPVIHELIEYEDTLYLIEEYIQGVTLQDQLDKGKRYSENEVLPIMLALCNIVSGLHSFDPPIIHRDIKPSNVIVSDEGAIKLLDLNAAKSYDADEKGDTTLIGTHGYAAPEQYGFGASSESTDIYAMGVLMNVLLTGTVSNTEICNGDYKSIIEKCLQLKPADRYSSVNELKNALLNRSSRQFKRRMLPPGFRSGKISHMIIGAFGYFLIFEMFFFFDVGDKTGASALSYRICIEVLLLALVLFNHNYLGIQNRVGFQKSWPWYFRLPLIVLADIIIFIIVIIVFALIGSPFGLV